jgi:hypothetical protein
MAVVPAKKAGHVRLEVFEEYCLSSSSSVVELWLQTRQLVSGSCGFWFRFSLPSEKASRRHPEASFSYGCTLQKPTGGCWRNRQGSSAFGDRSITESSQGQMRISRCSNHLASSFSKQPGK